MLTYHSDHCCIQYPDFHLGIHLDKNIDLHHFWTGIERLRHIFSFRKHWQVLLEDSYNQPSDFLYIQAHIYTRMFQRGQYT